MPPKKVCLTEAAVRKTVRDEIRRSLSRASKTKKTQGRKKPRKSVPRSRADVSFDEFDLEPKSLGKKLRAEIKKQKGQRVMNALSQFDRQGFS